MLYRELISKRNRIATNYNVVADPTTQFAQEQNKYLSLLDKLVDIVQAELPNQRSNR